MLQPSTQGPAIPPSEPQEPQSFTRIIPVPPPKPNEKLIEATEEFVPKWLRAARTMQEAKIEDQLRLENLFKAKLRLDYWNSSADVLASRLKDLLDSEADPTDWNSQMVIACAPFVLAFADNSFAAIFSSDEWMKVRPIAGAQKSSIEDSDYSTADKLTLMLDQKLTAGKIKARLYEALLHCALYDRVFGRLVWDEKKVPQYEAEVLIDPDTMQWAPNPETGIVEPVPGTGQPAMDQQTGKPLILQTRRTMKTVFAHPKIELIQPDNILPDPHAVDDDLQTWQGIGYMTEVTRAQILQRFADGVYNLNEDEFRKQFTEKLASTDVGVGKLGKDKDRDAGVDGETPWTGREWQYHGYIVTDDGDVECYCTYITSKDSDTSEEAESPEAGILVQLWEGTALNIGLRPFMTAQYTQFGVEGQGAVEPHFDYIYTISHLLNLMIDNLRLQVNCQEEVVEGSTAARNLASGKDGSDKNYPGKRRIVGELGKEIGPVIQSPLPYGELIQGIRELKNDLQLNTGVYTMRGTAARTEKTASEIHALSAQEQVPIENRLHIFIENFLNPALTMALAAIQQNSLEGVIVPVQDSHGMDQYVQVSSEEIRTGEYTVIATVGRQSSMRLAQAQTIERVLQLLPNIAPIVANEGNVLALTPLYRTLLELLQVPRLKEHIRPRTPEEQMRMQEQQAMAAAGPPGPPNQGPPRGGGGPPQVPQPPPISDEDALNMLLQLAAADAEGRSEQQ